MARNLLLTGGPGPDHDFAAIAADLDDLLAEPGPDLGTGFTTTAVTEPTAAIELLAAADEGAIEPWDLLSVHALRWDMAQDRYADQRAEHARALRPGDGDALAAFVAAGGGLLALHTAVICFDADPAWRRLVGASWAWGRSGHAPAGPVPIAVTETGRAHEITRDLDAFTVTDEVYGDLDLEPAPDRDVPVGAAAPLLTGVHEGRAQPVLWTRTAGRGRVVTDLLGHGPASLAHPVHRTIIRRAASWAARTTTEPKGP